MRNDRGVRGVRRGAAGHGINTCRCGAALSRCRCMGPHTPRIVQETCDRCRPPHEQAAAWLVSRTGDVGECQVGARV